MIGFALFYLHKYQTIPKYHEEQNNMDDSGDSGYACLQHDIAEKCAVNKSLSDLHNFEEVWSSNGIHIKYLESNANNLFVIMTEYSGIAQFSITFGGSTTNFLKEYAKTDLGKTRQIKIPDNFRNLTDISFAIKVLEDESELGATELTDKNSGVILESQNTIKALKTGVMECCNKYGVVIDTVNIVKRRQYVINSDTKYITIY